MGNSLGNFKEYTDAFEQYPHMCGGFIWDFVDQAIHKRKDDTDQWLYGSDFDEAYSPYGFRKKNAKGMMEHSVQMELWRQTGHSIRQHMK